MVASIGLRGGSVDAVLLSPVNGRNLLLEVDVTLVTGLSLLLDVKSLLESSSGRDGSRLENGNLFRGRPLLEIEARGSSAGSSDSTSGCCGWSGLTGRRALFPVGTMRTRVRVLGPEGEEMGTRPRLPVLKEVDESSELTPGPVGTLSSSSSSGVFPRTARRLPGKSSGTIGRPRTRPITGGGVTSSPGMNSRGVKFSVRNRELPPGRTRTTRTPVGVLSLVSPGRETGCLALGLVTSGSSGSLWT